MLGIVGIFLYKNKISQIERFIYIRSNHVGVSRNLQIQHQLLRHNVYPKPYAVYQLHNQVHYLHNYKLVKLYFFQRLDLDEGLLITTISYTDVTDY